MKRSISLAASSTRCARARRFKESPFVRRLWPESLLAETLPFFEHQRAMNRLLLDGASPLRHIEELHALLTRTSLQAAPSLGPGQRRCSAADRRRRRRWVLHGAVRARRAGAGRSQLFVGRRAVRRSRTTRSSGRDEPAAARVCLVPGRRPRDWPANLAQGDLPADPDRRHFWSMAGNRFGVGPGSSSPGSTPSLPPERGKSP